LFIVSVVSCKNFFFSFLSWGFPYCLPCFLLYYGIGAVLFISVFFHGFSLHHFFFLSFYVCELRIGPNRDPTHGAPVVVYGVVNNNARNIILTLGKKPISFRDLWSFAWMGTITRGGCLLGSRIGSSSVEFMGLEWQK